MPDKKKSKREVNLHTDPKLRILFESKLLELDAFDRKIRAREKKFGKLDVELARGLKK